MGRVAPVAAIKVLQGPSSPVAGDSAAHQEHNVVLLPSLLGDLGRDRPRWTIGFDVQHLNLECGHCPGCSTGGAGAGGGRPLNGGFVWLPIWKRGSSISCGLARQNVLEYRVSHGRDTVRGVAEVGQY